MSAVTSDLEGIPDPDPVSVPTSDLEGTDRGFCFVVVVVVVNFVCDSVTYAFRP